MNDTPFQPAYGQNHTVSATTTSASVTLGAATKSLLLVNSGSQLVYVRVGEGAQTATAADMPLRAGSEVLIGKPNDALTVAYLAAAATSTLSIMPGEGGA